MIKNAINPREVKSELADIYNYMELAKYYEQKPALGANLQAEDTIPCAICGNPAKLKRLDSHQAVYKCAGEDHYTHVNL